jgi:hypothetical protein
MMALDVMVASHQGPSHAVKKENGYCRNGSSIWWLAARKQKAGADLLKTGVRRSLKFFPAA